MASKLCSVGLGASILILAWTSAAAAQQSNACADFYDVAKGDRAADDVYVGIERPGHELACFLVPRAVIDQNFRPLYRDGVIGSIAFDPVQLSNYLNGATHIMVGADRRFIEPGQLSCLTNPTPDLIVILDHSTDAPITIEVAKSQMTESTSDLSGYSRYVDQYGDDNYFADVRPNAVASFWCSGPADFRGCGVVGNYDVMRAGIRFSKKDILDVRREEALQCVRAIGKLFRVK